MLTFNLARLCRHNKVDSLTCHKDALLIDWCFVLLIGMKLDQLQWFCKNPTSICPRAACSRPVRQLSSGVSVFVIVQSLVLVLEAGGFLYRICSDVFWYVLTCSDVFWRVLTWSDVFWWVLRISTRRRSGSLIRFLIMILIKMNKSRTTNL